MHLVNEHAGVEVARVVPVKRIPKTTSGKLQRNALAEAYENGEFAAELAEFDAAHGRRCTGRAAPPTGRIEQQLKAIVDDAMPGKHVDVDDNLFDVGASSLTLIQIHEKIDELYPGAVDLTELFDFPTIATGEAPEENAEVSPRRRVGGRPRGEGHVSTPSACSFQRSACATTTSRRGRRGSSASSTRA